MSVVMAEEDGARDNLGVFVPPRHSDLKRKNKTKCACGPDSPQFPHRLEGVEAPFSKGCRRQNDMIRVPQWARYLAQPTHSGGSSGHWDAMSDGLWRMSPTNLPMFVRDNDMPFAHFPLRLSFVMLICRCLYPARSLPQIPQPQRHCLLEKCYKILILLE